MAENRADPAWHDYDWFESATLTDVQRCLENGADINSYPSTSLSPLENAVGNRDDGTHSIRRGGRSWHRPPSPSEPFTVVLARWSARVPDIGTAWWAHRSVPLMKALACWPEGCF